MQETPRKIWHQYDNRDVRWELGPDASGRRLGGCRGRGRVPAVPCVECGTCRVADDREARAPVPETARQGGAGGRAAAVAANPDGTPVPAIVHIK